MEILRRKWQVTEPGRSVGALRSATLARPAVAAMVLLFGAAAAQSQGTVTDGDASFSYTGFVPADICNADIVTFVPGTVGGSTDVGALDWWWVGVGAAAEIRLPAPATQSYVADKATLTFTSISGVAGLNGALIGRVEDGDLANQASWYTELTLTNNTAGALTLDVIQHSDIEVAGSNFEDLAALAAPPDTSWIRITDAVVAGAFQDHRAHAPSGFAVGDWPALCNSLTNGVEDDLLNIGLPFGPGDYTGAFEWRGQVVAPGQSLTFRTATGIGEPAVPGTLLADGFESGGLGNWVVPM